MKRARPPRGVGAQRPGRRRTLGDGRRVHDAHGGGAGGAGAARRRRRRGRRERRRARARPTGRRPTRASLAPRTRRGTARPRPPGTACVPCPLRGPPGPRARASGGRREPSLRRQSFSGGRGLRGAGDWPRVCDAEARLRPKPPRRVAPSPAEGRGASPREERLRSPPGGARETTSVSAPVSCSSVVTIAAWGPRRGRAADPVTYSQAAGRREDAGRRRCATGSAATRHLIESIDALEKSSSSASCRPPTRRRTASGQMREWQEKALDLLFAALRPVRSIPAGRRERAGAT